MESVRNHLIGLITVTAPIDHLEIVIEKNEPAIEFGSSGFCLDMIDGLLMI
jgi:hypothetical protein